MDISPLTLEAEYERAVKAWPFIPAIEQRYGLPYMCLFAVGSRETNLTNEIGDGGHGHGVWQLDNRSHTIPMGFENDVNAQAIRAAVMLQGLFKEFGGNERAAYDGYNEGAGAVTVGSDAGTAGGDYGSDVEQRRVYLANKYPEADMTPEQATQLQEIHDALYGGAVTTPDGKTKLTLNAAVATIYNAIFKGGSSTPEGQPISGVIGRILTAVKG